MSARDFALAYGVGKSRFSQLGAEGLLPPPSNDPGDGAARWSRDVVFRFVTRQRRDEERPELRLPLLLPRAGVTWRLDRRRTVTVATTRDETREALTVSVHVMTYLADTTIAGHEAVVHLLTVLAPHSPARLRTLVDIPDGAKPVVELVLEQLHPDAFWVDADTDAARPSRIALVVPDTRWHYDGGGAPYDLFMDRLSTIEVFPGEGIDHASLARFSEINASDIATTLGHDLPLWPRGHVTADLVAAWRPNADPVTVTVPPFAEDQHKVLRWTERVAPGFGDDADDVRELGADLWRTRIGSLRDYQNMSDRAPVRFAQGWAPAVRWDLGSTDASRTRHNMMAGADAVLSSPATPRHLARAVMSYLGDPAVFAPLLLPTADLPPALGQALEDSVTPEPIPAEGSWRLFSLQQLLAETGVVPDAMRGARWRVRPRRPEGRPENHREPEVLFGRDLDGAPCVALHPPRDVPAELSTAEQVAARGVQLWIAPDAKGDAAFLLLTDDGLLVPLPVAPHDAVSSAWWLAHVAHGLPLHYGPGKRLDSGHPLVDLVRHATATKSATMIPWSRVLNLAVDARPDPR